MNNMLDFEALLKEWDDQNVCTCSLSDLMTAGCKCGQMEREREKEKEREKSRQTNAGEWVSP